MTPTSQARTPRQPDHDRAVGAEEDGTRIDRIRLRRIPDASTPGLEAFIAEAVETGSILHTGGWSGYDGVEALGYGQRATNIKRSGRPAQETMPRVHRVASPLKRRTSDPSDMGPYLKDAVDPAPLARKLSRLPFRGRRTDRWRRR